MVPLWDPDKFETDMSPLWVFSEISRKLEDVGLGGLSTSVTWFYRGSVGAQALSRVFKFCYKGIFI